MLVYRTKVTETGMSSRTRIVLGAIAASALALFALQSSALMDWLGFHRFGKVEHIRLGAYEGDVGALEWIAQDMGFYQQAGLEVDLKGFASGKDAAEALDAGQVDIATASEYVVATKSFSQPDLRMLGSISYYRNKGIVARRDHGISGPADLKGKRIGVTAPSGAEYSLYVFLALQGLSDKDVTIVNLPPKQLVDAIAVGDIDAAITWQPHVRDMEQKLGATALTFGGDGFDTYLLLVGKQKGLAAQLPVEKLMRALVLASDWVLAHPEDAKRYIAARFKLDPAYVSALWPSMPLDVTMPQELLIAMDGEARWLARKGGHSEGASIPNYAGFIDPGPLKTVKPSAVTVFTETRAAKPSAATAATER
jgi:NitT/TauT family transport system substrate-binding protein